MKGLGSDADLRGHLDRWVARGLIDAAQADRIEAAERAQAGQERAARAGPRVSLVVEALGYAGGVLAIVAGFLVVRELWPSIPTSAELAFAAAASLALGAAGTALLRTSDPALRRLRSVLWVLSTACLAAFAGVLADQVWRLGPVSVTLVTSAAGAGYGTVLWLRSRGALQHLALFAAVAVFTGSGIATLAPDAGIWAAGLGVWVLSVLWGLAAIRGFLPPRAAGCLAAGIGLLAGAQLTMEVAAGHVLAAATVAGLLAGGVLARQVWLVVLGTVGILLVVPQTATRYLPPSAGAPLAIFVVGMVLLGCAIWLARRRARPG